jgi:hypothetical protein
MVELSWKPRATVFKNFLSAEECELLIALVRLAPPTSQGRRAPLLQHALAACQEALPSLRARPRSGQSPTRGMSPCRS